MQRRLAVDCDGPLSNFLKALNKGLVGEGLTPIRPRTWDFFDLLDPARRRAAKAVMRRKGFVAGMEPTPGAKKAVASLREHFDEVVAVTSPARCRHWVFERTEWLEEQFGFTSDEIVFAKNKNLVPADALVDDAPHNLRKFKHGHRLLWSSSVNLDENEQSFIRVVSWSNAVDTLLRLYTQPVQTLHR